MKKIRFPLKMKDDIDVRTLKELKDNFSLVQILRYIKNGKLITWLRDREEDDIANAIEELDNSDLNYAKKVCEIFEVPYCAISDEDISKAIEKLERIDKLKKYTDETEYIDKIDIIAFNQDELFELLKKDVKVIYLCGEKFYIPLFKNEVTYVGINNPVVIIDSTVIDDWNKKNITLKGVIFDEDYQNIVDNNLEEFGSKSVKIGLYRYMTYIDAMIQDIDRKNIKKMYEVAKKEIECIDPLNRNSNKRLTRYKQLIQGVNSKIEKKKKEEEWSKNTPNTVLTLIYNYEKCNEYAKTIINDANIFVEETKNTIISQCIFSIWKEKHKSYNEFKNVNKAIAASNEFFKYCTYDVNKYEGHKFIFWALMVLTVDKSNAEEYLSLICNFANMLYITNDEFEDIIKIIKIIYNGIPSTCNEIIFKTERTAIVWYYFFTDKGFSIGYNGSKVIMRRE